MRLEKNPFHELMKVINEVAEVTRKSTLRFHSCVAGREHIKARKQRNERIGSIGYRRNVYKYWNPMTVYSPGDGSYYTEKPKGETDQN